MSVNWTSVTPYLSQSITLSCLSLQLKHTPEFMELARYQAMTTNTKFYFGPNIPSFFMQSRDEGLWLPRQQTTPTDKQQTESKS